MQGATDAVAAPVVAPMQARWRLVLDVDVQKQLARHRPAQCDEAADRDREDSRSGLNRDRAGFDDAAMVRARLVVIPLLLASSLSAQQAKEARKVEEVPAFGGGWNPAVGLGGGAGGLFGLRGKPAAGEAGAAIAAGLAWLQGHRDADGRWTGADPDDTVTSIAVTSLALLAMLGDGNTLRSGPCKDAIKTGIMHLRSVQRADGAFLPAGSDDTLTHSLATCAIAEAYVLSNYKLLEGINGKALAWLETHRREDGTHALVLGARADAVATLWSHWARMTGEFAGAVARGDHRSAIVTWLDSDDAGRLLERSLLPTAAIPGVDLALRQELDAVQLVLGAFVREVPREGDAARILKVQDRRRVWREGVDLHEWLCASHLVHQVGTAAEVDAVVAPLLVGQRSDGEHMGSWDPIDICGAKGGRAWSTAMAVLTLLAKKRYQKLGR